MTTQDTLVQRLASQDDLNRVPHPSHRHAAPSAPWPWIDLGDGLFFWLRVSAVITVLMKLAAVDQKQLKCVEAPIPELCDHSPESCNRCWKGYPQSRFPNWTEGQVRKAKIYNLVHNYSKVKPCVCYQVDVNDHGRFTNAEKMTVVHGDEADEDIVWDNLIHEQVSCSHIICGALPNKILILETTRYTIESPVHRKFVWTGSSDAGHEVSIFYPRSSSTR